MKRNATNIVWAGGLALVLILLGAGSAGCDARDASANTTSARVERGKYLVTSNVCNDCHTPWKMGPNGPEPDMTRMLSGHPERVVITKPAPALGGEWEGGAVFGSTMTSFSGPWGVSFSANLTPDRNTGLGIWTEDMFVRAIRTGKHFGVSRPILPPMPWQQFRHMTDEDLKSIFAYLRSIPPVTNHVPDPIPPVDTTH
jgi:hypothetical protein